MDFAAIFESAGVPFTEIGQWRTHVRPGTFTPEGVIIHHTGSTGHDATLRVVRYGRPDLNGPLCNIYVSKGRCYLVSGGRANHAGLGASEALLNVRHNAQPPGTAYKMGWQDDENLGGNGLFVGFEVLSPGKPSVELPQADWEVTAKASAAILRYLDSHSPANLRNKNRVIGHAEWTRRKVDPQFGRGADAHINMARLRQKVEVWL